MKPLLRSVSFGYAGYIPSAIQVPLPEIPLPQAVRSFPVKQALPVQPYIYPLIQAPLPEIPLPQAVRSFPVKQALPVQPHIYPHVISPVSHANSLATLPKPISVPVEKTLAVKPAPAPLPKPSLRWQNDLKTLFQTNQSVIYALCLRTFGAEDKNHDGQISPQLGEAGTFLSSVKRLDELKALGVNTLHVLPINLVGQLLRLGEAGSVYSVGDYHQLDPMLDTPGNLISAIQEARLFIEEAHKRGIHVMIDVPSCASIALAMQRPDLIAKDPATGEDLVPTNWIDIRMFENSPKLKHYYQGFFDLMVNQLGVDGFRVDVARVRPSSFWDYFIQKYPDKAWLAESYTQEDASPMANIPRDIPESLLKIGFDAIYGQFHIFHSMKSADEYLRYLIEGNAMLKRAGIGKSFIGSFLTHDDPSLMEHGGVTQYFLTSGLMATQPWTNPYILDGFTTGYPKHFDIFNYTQRPEGNHPEIGKFLQKMLTLRQSNAELVGQGLFIPIPVTLKGKGDNQVIAFARHHQGKTLLIVANKDINARQSGTLTIPGLKLDQKLQNLAPRYGQNSQFIVERNRLQVDLGPGRFHCFEIDTPDLPIRLQSYR